MVGRGKEFWNLRWVAIGRETSNINGLCTLVVILKELCYQYLQGGLKFTPWVPCTFHRYSLFYCIFSDICYMTS